MRAISTSRWLGALCGLGLMLAAVPARAHHSMVAEFSMNKLITLRGTLTRMEWTNPHGWIYVDVKGADGRIENWAIETGNPHHMKQRGLTKEDFRPGSKVIVLGYKAKQDARRAAGMLITFTDREANGHEGSFSLGR
jgi:Family of unknown function (DUF6152)